MLAERGAIIAQGFRNTVGTGCSQVAYYTEWAKWNSSGREYFISGFSFVAEMSQKLAASSQERALSDAFDHKNHPRAQHRRVAIVPLQGFDGSVVSAGNRDQGLTGLHLVTLHRSRIGRV